MIRRFQKRQEIENKERDKYKEVVCTLNKEVTTVTEKLKQEFGLQEKAQKTKDSLETELTTLCEQVETSNANAEAEFRASQPFIDTCVVYHGDEFDNCLKQVGFIYLNLELSKITMDDPMQTTPACGDTISEETDDSTHRE